MAKAKKSKNMYFTKETENAIIQYNCTDNWNTKNQLYNEYIKYAFEKLVENIIHTFKFYYFDVPPEKVKHEVISFLIMNIHKYNPDKGKAFSYFSIVTKNYLILHNNKNYKNYKIHDNIETLNFGRNTTTNYAEIEASNFMEEYVDQLVKYWENNLTNIFHRKKDISVADSILSLFKNRENIENFNKKYLYVLIREQTGTKTQHITRIVNIMKKHNKKLFREFNNTGCINIQNTGSFSI